MLIYCRIKNVVIVVVVVVVHARSRAKFFSTRRYSIEVRFWKFVDLGSYGVDPSVSRIKILGIVHAASLEWIEGPFQPAVLVVK